MPKLILLSPRANKRSHPQFKGLNNPYSNKITKNIENLAPIENNQKKKKKNEAHICS
jgi:hypothetical protein